MSVVSESIGDGSGVSTTPEGAALLLDWGAMDSGASSMVLARGSFGWKKTSEVSGSMGVGTLWVAGISPVFA
jgi:hypothetical protein